VGEFIIENQKYFQYSSGELSQIFIHFFFQIITPKGLNLKKIVYENSFSSIDFDANLKQTISSL